LEAPPYSIFLSALDEAACPRPAAPPPPPPPPAYTSSASSSAASPAAQASRDGGRCREAGVVVGREEGERGQRATRAKRASPSPEPARVVAAQPGLVAGREREAGDDHSVPLGGGAVVVGRESGHANELPLQQQEDEGQAERGGAGTEEGLQSGAQGNVQDYARGGGCHALGGGDDVEAQTIPPDPAPAPAAG
jgi:hypothetical protein